MPYDFKTLPDRFNCGSVKYDLMHKASPGVPPGIVPFTLGDMELRTPPELIDGLADYLREHVLGYTRATAEDRRAVTEWMRIRHGWRVDPEWFVGCDGVVAALYLSVGAFTEPDDGVVYMPPVYRPIHDAIENSGRKPLAVPLLCRDGEYQIDFQSLEKAVQEGGARLLLFCSPHNPVARVWRRDELERLGRICFEHDMLVVSDEVHMDFVLPGHRHEVFANISPEFAARSIICTSPAKTFNIAGLQVANLIIPDEGVREWCREAHFRTGRREANQLGLAASRIAYERCGRWVDGALELIRRNGELVRRFMAERFPEVKVSPHEGTYFVWLDFRAWGMDSEELDQFMVRRAMLFVGGGQIFGRGGEGFARVNIACPEWVLRKGLERLARAR